MTRALVLPVLLLMACLSPAVAADKQAFIDRLLPLIQSENARLADSHEAARRLLAAAADGT